MRHIITVYNDVRWVFDNKGTSTISVNTSDSANSMRKIMELSFIVEEP